MNKKIDIKIPLVCFASAFLLAQVNSTAFCDTAKILPMTELTPAQSRELLPYQDIKLSFGERAADLVSRMSLAQKATQLGNNAPGIPELGIRQYNWWSEALHGVARDGAATSFPTGLGIAATWDPTLVQQMMSAAGDEAREKFNVHANDHGLNLWSPTINLGRDPRWGRAEEGYGEDPYLTGAIATGFVKGLQGDGEDERYSKTLATSKHYMANNSEGNRHTGSSDLDEKTIREYYAYPFKKTVEEGKVACIMSAYNAVNGTPASVNPYILDELLRRTWGFVGFVVTDCGALNDVELRHTWRPGDQIVYRNPDLPTWDGQLSEYSGDWDCAAVTAAALYSGIDVNCGWVGRTSMQLGAVDAVERGLVSEDQIDVALVRLFTARMQTGEFDPAPMVAYAGEQYQKGKQIFAQDHLDLAEKAANEAVVLMKNAPVSEGAQPLLPLKAEGMKNIVILGHLADKVILGDYSTNEPSFTSSPLEGIIAAAKRANPNTQVNYIAGSNSANYKYLMNTKGPKGYDAEGKEILSVKLPTQASAYSNGGQYQESAENAGYLPTAGTSIALGALDLTGIKSMSIEMSGEKGTDAAPTRVELRSGTPEGKLLAFAQGEGSTGGWRNYKRYVLDVSPLSGGYDTKHDMVYLVVKHDNEETSMTEAELAQIKAADVVIAYLGTNVHDSGEANDRKNLNLPGNQEQILQQALALNPKTIVYMQAVGQMNIEAFKDQVPAILWCTYNGQAQGNAAGRLLFGEANPSAKLSFSWYSDLEQLDSIYDYHIRSTDGKLHQPSKGISNGRTYQYFTGDISYPFGHGLSYSQFEYSDLQLSQTELSPDDSLNVSFTITNTSKIDGKEIAQIYISSPQADKIKRPAKQLKGFDKKLIPAGQSVSFTINIPMQDLYFWDEEAKIQHYDQGQYSIEVASSASDAKALKATFSLSGQLTPQLQYATLIPTGHILKAGDAQSCIQSQLTVVRNNQSFVDLKSDSINISYTSSKPEVASVDQEGRVQGHSAGSAIISVTVSEGDTSVSHAYPVKVTD